VNGPQKVAGFVGGLAVVFVAAFGVGAAVGPDDAANAIDHSVPSAEPPPAESGHGH
jgi:hypothetical protein